MVSFQSVKSLLRTSSFRQSSYIAFVCLLISLLSIILGNQLLEAVMRTHVRDMVLQGLRTERLKGHLVNTQAALTALQARNPIDSYKDHILIFNNKSEIVFGNIHFWDDQNLSLPRANRWLNVPYVDYHGRKSELLGLFVGLKDGGTYFKSYDLTPMKERARVIPLIAGVGLLLITLSILLSSLPFGLFNLHRIQGIRKTIADFVNGDHEVRVVVEQDLDEIDQLGLDINRELHRINFLMEEVRSVTSHIAHELQTPLTRLQGWLQNAADLVVGDGQDDLQKALKESEHIQVLFKAVMRVGEVESGRCAHNFSAVKATDLITDVCDYYQPLAKQNNSPLVIDTADECTLYGDRDLLFQALANLIDNALKYGPKNTPITLFCYQKEQWGYLGVADHGLGIPVEKMATAVERFKRLDTQGNVSGNGLGLTLTQAICSLHGTDLTLSDNNPGLCATLKCRLSEKKATSLRDLNSSMIDVIDNQY